MRPVPKRNYTERQAILTGYILGTAFGCGLMATRPIHYFMPIGLFIGVYFFLSFVRGILEKPPIEENNTNTLVPAEKGANYGREINNRPSGPIA